MYKEYFNLKENPFDLTPDHRYLYLSKAHTRAKSYMDFSFWAMDSFIIITGEIGSGKTTLIERMISEMPADIIVAKIHQTQLNEVEFLQSLLVELGLNPFPAEKVELLSMINSFLAEQYVKNKKVVLIVDEAQNLTSRVLEEIRLLTGLESSSKKLLNVVLVGQPELNHVLNSPGMEQLLQRVRLRFHLKAIEKEEIEHYINYRLKVAGATRSDIFQKETFNDIYKYTGGIPRLINTLCDTALVCAFSEEAEQVDKGTIKIAVDELQWKPFDSREYHDQNKPDLSYAYNEKHNEALNKLSGQNIKTASSSNDTAEIAALFEALFDIKQVLDKIWHEIHEIRNSVNNPK